MTGRRPDRPASAGRNELIAAARALFAELGYAGTSTRQIAAAAGMQPGNLRHHFVSKAGLFTAVYEDCIAQVSAVVAPMVDGGTGVAPGDIVRRLGQLAAAAPGVAAFLAVAPLERSRHRELQSELGEEPVVLEHLVRASVGHWAAAGRVAPGVDTDALVDALIAAVYGVLLYSTRIDPTVDRTASFEALALMVDGSAWAR